MTNDTPDRPRPPVPQDETVIWRYVYFTQFLSILERSSLWFSRADLFEDPLEGSYSKANVETREDRYISEGFPEEHIDSFLDQESKMNRLRRNTSYLNCWHINNRESMAMWDLYSMEGQGIAIQSQIGKLKQSLREANGYILDEDLPIPKETPNTKVFTLGAVQYIDYHKHLIPESSWEFPLFSKRLIYKHEQEFRIMISRLGDALRDNDIYSNIPEHPEDLPPGEYIEIELSSLINRIYISPSAPDWFLELIEMIADRYSDVDPDLVTRSSLDEDPVF